MFVHVFILVVGRLVCVVGGKRGVGICFGVSNHYCKLFGIVRVNGSKVISLGVASCCDIVIVMSGGSGSRGKCLARRRVSESEFVCQTRVSCRGSKDFLRGVGSNVGPRCSGPCKRKRQ